VISGAVCAQHQTRTATPLGVAGGGPAFVRGQEALFVNPANLSLPERDRRSLVVGTSSLSIYTGGDLYRFGVYDATFTGGEALSDAEVDAALDDWFGAPQSVRVGGAYADFVPVTLSYHRADWAVGAAVRMRLHARIGLNRGWLDLALRGGRDGTPTPLHADWEALSTVDITVGGSRRLADGRWHVGVAPKLILGTEFLDARLRSTVRVSGERIRHDYRYRLRSTGRVADQVLDGTVQETDRLDKFNLLDGGPYLGSDLAAGGGFLRPFRQVRGLGLGLDVGATYRLRPRLLLSASLTDLGGIRWAADSQVLRPVQTQVTVEGVDLSDERLTTVYDGDLGAYVNGELVGPIDSAYTEVERRRTGFATALPGVVHVGADWRPRGPLLSVNGGVSMAINDVPGNITQVPAAHVGTALRLGDAYALVPRTGVRVGGITALVLAGGLGIRTPHASMDLGLSGTPYTDALGRGGRYTLGVTLRVSLPPRR